MITELISAIQVGLETKKLTEGLYNGEHFDDVTRAWNMYEAIDHEGENIESEIQEVLQCLEPVNSNDRLFVRVGAWTLKAWCYALLGQYAKARQFSKQALNAPIDDFTLNKALIKDLQADCKRLEILVHNAEHPDDPIIDYDNDETYQAISDIVDDAIADKLNESDFSDEDNIFDDLGADSLDAVELCMEIEEGLSTEGLSIKIYDEEAQLAYKYSIGEIKTALYIKVMGWDSPSTADQSSSDTSSDQISETEQEYLDLFEEYASEGEISSCDRKLLERFRIRLGITEERAKELENASTDLTEEEQEYLEMYTDYASDGEISERDRRLLDKFRVRCGISEERARMLEEASCSQPQLTEDEQEYLELFQEYAADGEISERDRKMLNKMRDKMGITEERAKEIEQL